MNKYKKLLQPYTDEEGNFSWPTDLEARNNLASELFGLDIVQSIDYWQKLASELINVKKPSAEFRRKNVDWESGQKFREKLADLPKETRETIEQLIFDTVTGSIFSILASMDQFPEGITDLRVLDENGEKEIANITEGSIFELHDRLHNWIESNSEFKHLNK